MWTWIRKNQNGIHSSNFDVVFFSPFQQKGDRMGILRAEMGCGLFYDFLPVFTWLQLQQSEKRNFSRLGKSTAYEADKKEQTNKKKELA
jgi:hypothetical protein